MKRKGEEDGQNEKICRKHIQVIIPTYDALKQLGGSGNK